MCHTIANFILKDSFECLVLWPGVLHTLHEYLSVVLLERKRTLNLCTLLAMHSALRLDETSANSDFDLHA